MPGEEGYTWRSPPPRPGPSSPPAQEGRAAEELSLPRQSGTAHAQHVAGEPWICLFIACSCPRNPTRSLQVQWDVEGASSLGRRQL